MKKFGIGSRLLAMLLALTMIVSVFPASVFAADGDISAGNPGLDKDETTPDTVIDTKDTISWPIKVYDYLNDGLLFEYASAQDTSLTDMDGDAYGGGEPMPEVVLGNDYTYNGAGTTATTGVYLEKSITHWLPLSGYSTSLAQKGKTVAKDMKYLRLVPERTYTTVDIPAMVISDFANDNGTSYAKERVRYVTLVYRTNIDKMELIMGASTNLVGNFTVSNADAGGYATEPDKTSTVNFDLASSVTLNAGGWNYVVVDLCTGTLGSRWSSVTDVYQVILDSKLLHGDQYIDLTHIAYYANKEEAERFGEKAAAFANNPGEYLPTQYYSVTTGGSDSGSPSPSGANWSLDFTGSAAYSSATASAWAGWSLFNGSTTISATQGASDKVQFARFGCDYDSAPDNGTFVEFDSAQKISDIRYMTIVYRSSEQSAACTETDCNQVNFWFESSELQSITGSYNYIGKGANVAHYYEFDHKTGWNAVTFDLLEHEDLVWEMNNNGVTTLDRIKIVCPGFDENHGGAEYMDISHIAFHGDKTKAEAYGAAALKYNMNPSTASKTHTGYKSWNMGNNTAFTMLYASSGGGWGGNVGGNNTWTNGYYSYQIGEHTSETTNAATVNERREVAKTLGYPVPKDIYFFYAYGSADYDLADYDFGYTLLNLVTDGVMTAGLLQNDLIEVKAADGMIYRIPHYKQDTVDYIAVLLQNTLPIGETDHTGSYNYNFVKGSPSSQFGGTDLATALRNQLGLTDRDSNTGNYIIPAAATNGSYKETMKHADQLIGAYADVKGNIKTFHDAAYYLLHNLFIDDSYNQLQNDYNYLVLSKAKVDGTEAFVFDGGFTTGNATADSKSAVKYDKNTGTISLISAVGKDEVTFSGNQLTTRYPFLPVQDSEGEYARTGKYLSNGTPYFEEDGAMSMTDYGATYATRNYNYVLQANAEFIYHVQDDLFFQFEGDDDVYLFVNNELVLDIGAAHSITKVKMNMNDYVLMAQEKLLPFKENFGYRADQSDEKFHEAFDKALAANFKINGVALTEADRAGYLRWHHLNLVGGETYPIDFYYMERHGWGANMRVATNIVMTDPAMDTQKKAYQDGAEITYGGIVDASKKVEYSFSTTNEGLNKLYNLKFHDYDIGLSLTPENGLSFHKDGINGVSVTDVRGQTLEASDLVVHVDGYKDEAKLNPVSLDIRFDGPNPEAELKQFLRDLTSTDGTDDEESSSLYAGKGLWRHATVTIRGIYYQLTEEQIKEQIFNNTVFTTANPAVDSETVLNSEDTHQIRVIGEAQHIYQWAEHEVYFSLADLAQWKGGDIEGFSADDLVVTTCTKAGQDYDYPDVLVKDERDIYVNYLKTGTRLFFLKAQLDTNGNGVFEDMDGDGVVNDADTIIIPIMVYVTDLNDDIVVLDYGLKAELTGKNGITANDYITVPNHETSYTIMGLTGKENTPSYLTYGGVAANLTNKNLNRISFAPVQGTSVVCNDGVFNYADDGASDKLFFTPNSFMDEEYEIYMAVTVHENPVPSAIGTGNTSPNGYSIDITKEVQMFQKVTVLPATVMYYEDDFPSLNYVNKTDDFTHSGEPTSGKEQGVDQSVNYGADKVYQTGENKQSSLGSLTSIKISEYQEVANFTFRGTGFEIIGRTNAFDSASFVLTVKKDGSVIRNLPVITEFSNKLDATCPHDKHSTTGHCADCGIYTGHTYYQDVCTVCNALREEFYLVGYINEANYGCEEDYLNMGQYKFEEGKLTATFKTDGYVFVKTSNNSNWFMTDGYPGTGTRSAFLYDSVALGERCDKLHVPGGVQLTFTLAETMVGGVKCLNLSYTTANDDLDSQNKTVYFNNTEKWDTVKAYYWSYANATMVEWPGKDMTPKVDDIYQITLPADAEYVIFNNGTTQTPDLTVPGENMIYNFSGFNEGWSEYVEGKITVNFDKAESGWKDVYCHYWNAEEDLTQWPGVQMTHKENSIYTISIPENAEMILFHNGEGQQTDDLEILVSGAAAEDTYTYGVGWASTGETTARNRLIYFRNNDNWEKINVHYWQVKEDGTNLNLSVWPGDSMDYVSQNVYKAAIPENATHVVFNNGNGVQTADLTLDASVNLYNFVTETYDLSNGYWTAYAGAAALSDITAQADGQTLYLDNAAGWATPYAYYWPSSGSAPVGWPGTAMTKVSGNRYSIVVPDDCNMIIFSNNGSPQTDDLSIPTDGKNLYNNASKQWSIAADNEEPQQTKPVYFLNAHNWGTVNVYYWSTANDKMTPWPGVAMNGAGSGVYSQNIPEDAEFIIFNDGSNQTADLTIPADGNYFTYPKLTESSWESYAAQRMLYVEKADTGWGSSLSAIYWSSKDATEKTVQMFPLNAGSTLYIVSLPMDAQFVRFTDGTNATGDLTISDSTDKYTIATASWSNTTRTIYFTGSGTDSVLLTYWSDTMGEAKKVMTLVKGQVYKCDIPVEAKYVTFKEGDGTATAQITLTDDYNLYDAGKWTNYNPSADYLPVIYFKNTQNWGTVKVYSWNSQTQQKFFGEWPGALMTHVDGDVYTIKVPIAADYVIFNNDQGAQTVDLKLEAGNNLFTMDASGQEGKWSKFYRVETDAIHQVPVLRVDGLELGDYEVIISGMPTYTEDVDWSKKEDYVKPTYLYIDGVRIYQPLGDKYPVYSGTENGAQFKEVRNLILEGYAAVAQYEENKNTLYSGNVSWTENRNGTTGDLETVYIGNQVSEIDDYMLIGPNNEAYLNGNAQTQAVIMYVSETDEENHSLQIGVRGIDEGLFLKGVASGVNATLYLGVRTEDPAGNPIYGWTPIDTVLSGTEQYYTINYKNCPSTVTDGKTVYQVALYVRSGMLSFTNLKYLGLNVMSKEVGAKTDETLNNGVLYKPEMESGSGSGTTGGSQGNEISGNDFYFTLEGVSQQMAATEQVENTESVISLAYPSLSFEDEVFYNIYYDVKDANADIVEMGLMTFDSLDADATVNEALSITSGYQLSDGKYVVRSEGVAAKDLGRTLYFKVFAQLADGRYVYSDVKQYSALDYAKSVLLGNYTKEMKAMVCAMLNYGAAAQNYFGGISPISDLLSSDATVGISGYSADLLNDVVNADLSKVGSFAATAAGFAKKYPTVSFEGAFSINYYFTPDANVQGDMTLYYWNAEDYSNADVLSADNATGTITMTPGTAYEAAVEGIAAKDMDGTVYVAAVYSDGTNTYCSGVLAYSLSAYCESLAGGTDRLSTFAQATAVYGYYAKQLFA